MLPHSHYSPYQFSNGTQLAQGHTKTIHEKKAYVDEHLKTKKRTRDLGCTIPISEAHLLCSMPNAFISPNTPDVIRQTKSIFGF